MFKNKIYFYRDELIPHIKNIKIHLRNRHDFPTKY